MLRWSCSGIVVAVILLAIVEAVTPASLPARIFIDTLWWSIGGFVVATLLVDRFIETPTAEGGIWVAFSSAASFAALVVLFGATHSAYSRSALAAAYVLVTLWLYAGVRLRMRHHWLRLGVPETIVTDLLAQAHSALAPRLTHVQAELVETTELAELRQLDGMVIDRYSVKDAALQRLVTQVKLDGVRIYSADHVYELLTGRLSLQHTEDSFLDESSGRVMYAVVKRVLDIAGALTLLAIVGLPMMVIALAIRLESRGPAVFRQERVGRGGRVFEMLKFRTMHVAESTDAVPYAAASSQADARVTVLGSVLRKFRLDELPQLLNVLGGTMSLIGPRPEWTATATEFFDHIPHYPYRHLVRPGITGWAQVNQGHVTGLDNAMLKLELDLYYVKHMSFALDLVIGVRTLRTVVTGFGAR